MAILDMRLHADRKEWVAGRFATIETIGSTRPLEFRISRRARERDHVADVGHAGDELDHSLQTEAEAGVGYGAKPAQVEVPPVVGGVEALFFHAAFQHVEPLFALAAADDFTDAWDEDVHRS